jgi:hypothetical protein
VTFTHVGVLVKPVDVLVTLTSAPDAALAEVI